MELFCCLPIAIAIVFVGIPGFILGIMEGIAGFMNWK